MPGPRKRRWQMRCRFNAHCASATRCGSRCGSAQAKLLCSQRYCGSCAIADRLPSAGPQRPSAQKSSWPAAWPYNSSSSAITAISAIRKELEEVSRCGSRCGLRIGPPPWALEPAAHKTRAHRPVAPPARDRLTTKQHPGGRQPLGTPAPRRHAAHTKTGVKT